MDTYIDTYVHNHGEDFGPGHLDKEITASHWLRW